MSLYSMCTPLLSDPSIVGPLWGEGLLCSLLNQQFTENNPQELSSKQKTHEAEGCPSTRKYALDMNITGESRPAQKI